MAGTQRIECATFEVAEPTPTIDFCTEVMGLIPLQTTGDTTYLGCGLDGNYDLAIREGEDRLASVTFRMTAEEYDRQVAALEDAGVETDPHAGPGHERGVAFELPYSGVTMGLVEVVSPRYHHSAGATHFLDSTSPIEEERVEYAPLDLDHIGIFGPDIEAEARWLVDVLDFTISDAKVTDGEWDNGFIRYGAHHHDISVFSHDSDDTHHHLAWTMSDISHMKLYADRQAQRGHQLELGFVKHGPGANISFYFQEPNGIRFEYATELSTLDPDTPEGIYEASRRSAEEGISLWGGIQPPKSFRGGF